jgi:hypothetical protein
MSRRPISRSADLGQLVADGYTVEVTGGKLVVRDIPFVDHEGTVHHVGALVMALTLAGETAQPPGDHTASFSGGVPCDAKGQELTTIINGKGVADQGNGIVTQCTFSMKPTTNDGKYPDFHDKVAKYVAAISSPVADIDPSATARVHRPVVPDSDAGSPFNYEDTASSRAGITAINEKLAEERVAIVGLGGTGEYILDFVAKTLAPEIHVFDDDVMLTHNAFRAPGAPTLDELNAAPLKVDHYTGIYSRMHNGIVAHPYAVTEANVAELAAMTFVFISIDDAAAKTPIIAALVDAGIAFIDVGMGVNAIDGHLSGIVRTTMVTPDKADHLATIPTVGDVPDGDYKSNIQIAELNARNASDAVIRWKKYRGVYADLAGEHFTALKIATNHVINQELLNGAEDDPCD